MQPPFLIHYIFFLPHLLQSLTNLQYIWHRLSSEQASQKSSHGFLSFKTVCTVKPIKVSNEASMAKKEARSFLSRSLLHRHHTWYMGLWPRSKDVQRSLCNLTSRGCCNNQRFGTVLRFSKPFVPYSQSKLPAVPPNRKLGCISNGWWIHTKLATCTQLSHFLWVLFGE